MPPRREVIRGQNDRIGLAARSHRFRDERLPFLCECDDDACREFIMLPLAEFESLRRRDLYVVARGHRFPGGTRIEGYDDYDAFQVSA